jgi:CheY-like chemotaxis protein
MNKPLQSRISDFVAVLPEPSLLLTTGGELLYLNGPAEDLFGADARRMIGKRIHDLSIDAHEAIEEYLKASALSRQLIPGVLKLRGKNGDAIRVRCHACMGSQNADGTAGAVFLRCHPLGDDNPDQFVQMSRTIAALSRDVVERKISEQQLEQSLHAEREARMEAERAVRLHDEFRATLSHSLRNPLDAILGWATLLEKRPLDPAAAEGVEVIARNARLQKQLIEELLDRRAVRDEHAPPSTPSGQAAVIDDAKDLDGVDILIVDDEPDARELLKRLLQGRGAAVRTAGSAREALKLFEAAPPAVLISDIGMPVADGYPLIRAIRRKNKAEGGEAPAIALTAFARSEDRMRAMIAGFNLHLSKPVEPTELLVAVASLVLRARD